MKKSRFSIMKTIITQIDIDGYVNVYYRIKDKTNNLEYKTVTSVDELFYNEHPEELKKHIFCKLVGQIKNGSMQPAENNLELMGYE